VDDAYNRLAEWRMWPNIEAVYLGQTDID